MHALFLMFCMHLCPQEFVENNEHQNTTVFIPPTLTLQIDKSELLIKLPGDIGSEYIHTLIQSCVALQLANI